MKLPTATTHNIQTMMFLITALLVKDNPLIPMFTELSGPNSLTEYINNHYNINLEVSTPLDEVFRRLETKINSKGIRPIQIQGRIMRKKNPNDAYDDAMGVL